MAVKIRLQRHGKKDAAFFHVVVADGRAPRDGKFIEKLGVYNPNSNPATIDINFDSTLISIATCTVRNRCIWFNIICCFYCIIIIRIWNNNIWRIIIYRTN